MTDTERTTIRVASPFRLTLSDGRLAEPEWLVEVDAREAEHIVAMGWGVIEERSEG